MEYKFDFNYNTTSLNTWTGDALALSGIWQLPKLARSASLTGDLAAFPLGFLKLYIFYTPVVPSDLSLDTHSEKVYKRTHMLITLHTA